MKSTYRNIAFAALPLFLAFAAAGHTDQAPEMRQGKTLAEQVRQAGSRFKDVAVAVREGYSPIPCTSGVDGGAMGIHYVNSALIGDEAVDLGRPEAVMYEPGADGRLKLVAVEYITTKGPASLGGQLFSLTNAPNRYGLPAFYELHVWAWKDNPKGVFADMNPTVSCEHAHDSHS